MCMHVNNIQFITAETKKHPLCILSGSRGLWILENSVSLSGIFWWLRPRVSINRNSWIVLKFYFHIWVLNYFCRIQERMLCSTHLPNQPGHPSQSGSMDHVPGRSPVGSGEQALLDVQPAQKHGTLWIPCQVCSPEGLWGKKEEKMAQIALFKNVWNTIYLGANHRVIDYFGLKRTLKTI